MNMFEVVDGKELIIRGIGQSYDSLPSRFKVEDMAFTKLRSVYK